MDGDQALLLCTDGLTDMVPSATIEQIVRRHAGRPQEVADALVDAANAIGGHDNVTVVYAEGAAFATRSREAVSAGSADAVPVAQEDCSGPRPPAAASLPRRAWRHIVAFGRWVIASRSTWFAVGALAGVLAALALVWRVGDTGTPPPRTLVVGAAAPGAFPQISAALSAATPGDSVPARTRRVRGAY